MVYESSSMLSTSPATSFEIWPGLNLSSTWNSPMCCISSISYFRVYILRAFNNVHDSWAKIMSDDGLAGMNFSEPCHHEVRFVNRAFFIEPVNFHIFVVFVRDALEANL